MVGPRCLEDQHSTHSPDKHWAVHPRLTAAGCPSNPDENPCTANPAPTVDTVVAERTGARTNPVEHPKASDDPSSMSYVCRVGLLQTDPQERMRNPHCIFGLRTAPDPALTNMAIARF